MKWLNLMNFLCCAAWIKFSRLLVIETKNYNILLICITQISKYIVCTSPFWRGEGVGWASNQIFKKGALTRPQLLERGCLERGGGGVTFFMGCCNFHIKSKLKSEIFNDKKSWSAKIIFTVITKNSNWEILRFLGFIEKSNFQGGSRKSSIEGRLPKMGSLHSLPI